LGPFSCALATVVQSGDQKRKIEERYAPGSKIRTNGALGHWEGVFVTFRGCTLDKEFIKDY